MRLERRVFGCKNDGRSGSSKEQKGSMGEARVEQEGSMGEQKGSIKEREDEMVFSAGTQRRCFVQEEIT